MLYYRDYSIVEMTRVSSISQLKKGRTIEDENNNIRRFNLKFKSLVNFIYIFKLFVK